MVGAGAATDAARALAAREVCAASAAFASCTHRRRRRSSPRGPHFVDWYLVLSVSTSFHSRRRRRLPPIHSPILTRTCSWRRAQIGEAASEDAVRRRYRQLALQLHPDKNRHPKAEVAFKIVSEAHACLTDQARRRAFDLERRGSFCAACHDRYAARWSQPASGHQAPAPAASRSKAARETIQSRLRDECRVIDGCLRANDAAACARRRQSFPLFDPSDGRRFPDYPHVRPPPFELRHSEDWLGRAAVDRQALNRRWCRGGGESPVYQIRTVATECTDRRAW
ncbi:DnaJ domain containing protein [Zea mays]|uniref:DnaJ domain containing protein n=1 Tax=Zea mays TaxID=4577 RepID=A0A1D6LAI2_MAIZE|nr:DnaJ domain containing protein [Zea mays]